MDRDGRRPAFTLIELLIVIGIIAILVAMLIPLANKARASAKAVQCGSNLRQIGQALTRYFNDYRHLPARTEFFLSVSNPHVFKYQNVEPIDRIPDLMEKYAGSRAVYYCPANDLGRNLQDWWPYKSGTVASTYQFPFWLNESSWVIPKPDYRKLTSERVIAADYLGVALDFQANVRAVAWNHERLPDGSPRGMNMLFGDGHVEWRRSENRWQIYGYGFGNIFWFWANPG